MGAKVGCVACKRRLADIIVERMAPIYERQQELKRRPDDVFDVLREGAKKAQIAANNTLVEMREAMNLRDF